MLLKKRTLLGKIPAVSAHESKSGSCSSELSLQALVQTRMFSVIMPLCNKIPLLHLWVTFLYWNQTGIWKNYSVVKWSVDKSEDTWKQATKCNKYIILYICTIVGVYSFYIYRPKFRHSKKTAVWLYNFIIGLKSYGISCSRHRTTKFPNSESPIFTTKFLFWFF